MESVTPRAMGDSVDELMTLQEIARHLKVSERTVLRMTKAGDIPAGKVAGQWRFSRTAVDSWLTERVKSRSTGNLVSIVGTKKRGLLRLTDLLTPERVILDLVPGTKEDMLRQLVAPIATQQIVPDPQKYVELLLTREEMLSTAVGNGIALPHARQPESAGLRETCLVLGISRSGVDFDSLDGAPTHLVFLVGSKNVADHLRLLAKVTLMLRTPHVAKGLKQATSKDDIRHLVMEAQVDLSIRL